MATRNVYYLNHNHDMKMMPVNFRWQSGWNRQAKQMSAHNLHQGFLNKHPQAKLLEISSVGKNKIGVQTSAMHLNVYTSNPAKHGLRTSTVNSNGKPYGKFKVENVFQAGKVFQGQTPEQHQQSTQRILNMNPVQAKHTTKAMNSRSQLKGFKMFGHQFPLQPKTDYYDYVYMHGLAQHPKLGKQIASHNAFSDFFAVPGKTINTQSKSCTLFTSLVKKHGWNGMKKVLNNKKLFTQAEQKADLSLKMPNNHLKPHNSFNTDSHKQAISKKSQKQATQSNIFQGFSKGNKGIGDN